MTGYLEPTEDIDCDHPLIKQLVEERCRGKSTIESAILLFYLVRDEIRYTVSAQFYQRTAYRASVTMQRKDGYCVQKAVLLAALLRAVKIPARLHFADLRNRLTPEPLKRVMGTDLFAFHGYVEMQLNGAWLKATPSFDQQTCEKHRIVPVAFDGTKDALLHKSNADGLLQFEYLTDRGHRSDLPFDELVETIDRIYGRRFDQEDARNLF